MNDKFEIYLLADSSFHANYDQINIDTFTLVDTPIITVNDIVSYNWSDHKIILSEEGMKKNSAFFKKLLKRPIHIPFIVCVGNERVYLGKFVSGLSSSHPKCPYILYNIILPFAKDKSKEDTCYYLKIEKSLTTLTKNDIDIRNDKRIYNSLKKSGVL